MAYTRQWLVDTLRHIGYSQEAEDALREMPDEFDEEQLVQFAARHGISRGEVIERMGGSP
jgi:hypothetical protein